MTPAELQDHAEQNWLRVPAAERERCVHHLRDLIPEESRKVFSAWFQPDGTVPGFFHMFGGMTARNMLRTVLPDDLLPDVIYDGDTGPPHRCWDDFYMAALRQAVAPAPGEA